MCCGDIVNWSINPIENNRNPHQSCCGADEKNVEDACCEDADIQIKLDQPHITSSIDYLFSSIYVTEAWVSPIHYDQSEYVVTDYDDIGLYPNPPPNLAEKIGLFIYFKKLKLAC